MSKVGWMVVLGACVVGCSSTAIRADGGANSGGTGGTPVVVSDSGSGGSPVVVSEDAGTLTWGMTVLHLTGASPVALDTLAGLSVRVTDPGGAPSPLDTTIHWPADPRPLDPATPHGSRVRVLHGCTGPDPIDFSIEGCATGDPMLAGCMRLSFGQDGILGRFTHPNGQLCEIRAGQGELSLRRGAGQQLGTADFVKSDVSAGQFSVRCTGGPGGVSIQLDGTFELNVARSILAC